MPKRRPARVGSETFDGAPLEALDRDIRAREDLSNLSGPGLALAVNRGEAAALAEAHTRHGAEVHALVTGFCVASTAESVVHDVFMAWWREPASFDPERGTLRSWLLANAHRLAVERVRWSPETRADSRAGLRAQHNEPGVLAALPEREAQAIALAYFGGYPCKEVARMLQRPERAVARDIRNGLCRIRSLKSGQAFEEPTELDDRLPS